MTSISPWSSCPRLSTPTKQQQRMPTSGGEPNLCVLSNSINFYLPTSTTPSQAQVKHKSNTNQTPAKRRAYATKDNTRAHTPLSRSGPTSPRHHRVSIHRLLPPGASEAPGCVRRPFPPVKRKAPNVPPRPCDTRASTVNSSGPQPSPTRRQLAELCMRRFTRRCKRHTLAARPETPARCSFLHPASERTIIPTPNIHRGDQADHFEGALEHGKEVYPS